MAIYANELEPRVAKTNLAADALTHGTDSVPVADAVATVDESGKRWALAVVNRHPNKPLAFTMKLEDRPLDGTYATVVLAGDSPEAFNDIEHPDRVVPENKRLKLERGALELPPHSLTVLKVNVA